MERRRRNSAAMTADTRMSVSVALSRVNEHTAENNLPDDKLVGLCQAGVRCDLPAVLRYRFLS